MIGSHRSLFTRLVSRNHVAMLYTHLFHYEHTRLAPFVALSLTYFAHVGQPSQWCRLLTGREQFLHSLPCTLLARSSRLTLSLLSFSCFAFELELFVSVDVFLCDGLYMSHFMLNKLRLITGFEFSKTSASFLTKEFTSFPSPTMMTCHQLGA